MGGLEKIQGRAWVLGDNVDTDQIIQGRYLTLLSYEEMAQHALKIPRPDFASGVKKNDIVVAGRNFGSGSSREEAPSVLKELGVGCVVAESFSRIFYRNGFNVGLPLMLVKDVSSNVQDGNSLTIDFTQGTLTNNDTGKMLQGEPLPPLIREILEAGGAVSRCKKLRK
ncbi:MAG: LeuD/DmdB family oxidoreductase small subunit [Candidatus Thorarchaeota archaeon]|jgi:3-isopropylmalate/(R)-2-methylmalate dehydratase small subunit